MHALKMLHQLLEKNCPNIHRRRLSAIMIQVQALMYGHTLTVTGLGRSRIRTIGMKHAIKQSDRLIGNPHLHQERWRMYQAITRVLLHRIKRPLISIDWSDYTYDRSQLLLRAAVAVGGRTLTLYEEVHPYRHYGNARIQKRFLNTLHTVVPAACRPIIITDAGFGGPWFRAVQQKGWDTIGRTGKHLMVRSSAASAWVKCQTLHRLASAKPRYLGEVDLVRSRPLRCHLYLYKKSAKGRHKLTRQGHKARSKHSQKNARREQSPWILATSLDKNVFSAKQVVQLYRTRMQIEEAFRDIKNQRNGFSLSETRSHSPERLANLLLIGMLATFMLWLIGRLAEEKQLHYQYQANTLKTQRVLSLFYLGGLLIRQGKNPITQRDCYQAIKLIQYDMLAQWNS